MARMAKGDSPEKVHARLVASGVPDISVRTVARRMAALRPEANAARAKTVKAVAAPPNVTAGPPLPDKPEDLPDDASMETLLFLRSVARESLEVARTDGDIKLVGQLLNSSGIVEDRIQRRTPRTPEDPNEAPDMVALGKSVEERFAKMVDMVLEER